MSDDETTTDGQASRSPARVLTKKERREERRRAAREAAEREEQEDDAPEPEPTVCAWCGFSAFFEDEASEADKAKCPACGITYGDVRQWTNDNGQLLPMSGDDGKARDAVHRRIATALDSIFALLSEQWEAAQEAAEARAGFR